MFHFEFPPQSNELLIVKRYLNRQTRRLANGLDLLAATPAMMACSPDIPPSTAA